MNNNYEGEKRNGIPHGKGSLIFHDGSTYIGVFRFGKIHGKGEWVFAATGNKYIGDLVNGKFHGQGLYIYSYGDRYEGRFQENQFHGFGKYTYSNGSSYEGDFIKGKAHGQGTFISNNGETYNGNFWNGNYQGFEILTNAEDKLDKSWYENEFLNVEFNELNINQYLIHTENKSNEDYYNSLPNLNYQENIYNFSEEEWQQIINLNLVKLINPITGEIKIIKIGWSWTCFLFSGTFGIPLFLRGLNTWGGVMCCIGILIIFKNMIILSTDLYLVNIIMLDLMGGTFAILGLCLSIWLGSSANRMYGILLLEKGWIFLDNDSVDTEKAKKEWNLNIQK